MAINLVLMRDCSDMSYANKVKTISIYFFIVCVSHIRETLSEEFNIKLKEMHKCKKINI